MSRLGVPESNKPKGKTPCFSFHCGISLIFCFGFLKYPVFLFLLVAKLSFSFVKFPPSGNGAQDLIADRPPRFYREWEIYMTTSIIEQSDGTSYVVVTSASGEHQVVDVTDAYSREELAQIDVKSFLGNVDFNYALLGSQCAADEEMSYQCEVEDAFI